MVEWRRPLERPSYRWKASMKTDVNEMVMTFRTKFILAQDVLLGVR